jgi:hypothetical protein
MDASKSECIKRECGAAYSSKRMVRANDNLSSKSLGNLSPPCET